MDEAVVSTVEPVGHLVLKHLVRRLFAGRNLQIMHNLRIAASPKANNQSRHKED